ncbi:MAG: hypothetical protein HQL60_04805 [Magnetococcales bacterium]|nr:hypothetical protein [Magnetococcales bacterium]
MSKSGHPFHVHNNFFAAWINDPETILVLLQQWLPEQLQKFINFTVLPTILKINFIAMGLDVVSAKSYRFTSSRTARSGWSQPALCGATVPLLALYQPLARRRHKNNVVA